MKALDGYDLVVILLDTGARYTEIANVRWESINLTDRTITLWRPKVQNESILYMTNRVHRILERRHGNRTTEYVFTNQSGGPRGYRSGSIRKAFRRAGLSDCSIHTLRHTHATRLLQNGMSIYEVKEILRHTDIKTTMRYAHLERRDVSSRARDVIDRLNKENGKPKTSRWSSSPWLICPCSCHNSGIPWREVHQQLGKLCAYLWTVEESPEYPHEVTEPLRLHFSVDSREM